MGNETYREVKWQVGWGRIVTKWLISVTIKMKANRKGKIFTDKKRAKHVTGIKIVLTISRG